MSRDEILLYRFVIGIVSLGHALHDRCQDCAEQIFLTRRVGNKFYGTRKIPRWGPQGPPLVSTLNNADPANKFRG
jgi:hypothetical protein